MVPFPIPSMTLYLFQGHDSERQITWQWYTRYIIAIVNFGRLIKSRMYIYRLLNGVIFNDLGLLGVGHRPSYVTLNSQWSSILHGLQATVSTICAGYDRSDASLAKASHPSWSPRLFYLGLTSATHWIVYSIVYHAPPSNHHSVYRTQLLVWCWILFCVMTTALKQLVTCRTQNQM